ncbi:MAG: hypothetical protein BIFFINMI_04050 [Phycisphaerae bacterium]|nr:hypothetical protein [Phycisphaerae bacterium]
MKNAVRYITLSLILVAGGSLSLLAGCDEGEDQPKSGTLEDKAALLADVRAAHAAEVDSHARYAACAARADEEGYARVAALFRAIARSEQVRAAAHAAVLTELEPGGQADARPRTPAVKSTVENMADALQSETLYRDKTYPRYVRDAFNCGEPNATRSMDTAQRAEVEIVRLLQAARDSMEGWKAAGTPFYVCPVCGLVSEQPVTQKCPACFTPCEKFEKVN